MPRKPATLLIATSLLACASMAAVHARNTQEEPLKDDYGLVSQNDADHCGKMAIRVRREVEEWIRKTHTDKIV